MIALAADVPPPLARLCEPSETERFVVRGVDERDVADLLVVNGDDAVTRFLPYASWRSVDDGRAWLERIRTLEATGGARQLVVVERAADRAIGGVTVFAYDVAAARAEIGYVVARDRWRTGVMREVLPGVVDRAFDAVGLLRLEAWIEGDNVASVRLLDALGFRHEGTLRRRVLSKDGRPSDMRVHALLRDEWLASR